MAQSYCPHSETYEPLLGSDKYYCNSQGNPKYSSSNNTNSFEVTYEFRKEWCNNKDCFECPNYYPKKNIEQSNADLIFCKDCGKKVPRGKFCTDCGSKL